MRIGINLYLLQPHTGGVSNYVMQFLRHWSTHFPEHPLVPFTFPVNDPLPEDFPADCRKNEIRLNGQHEIARHLDDMDLFFCPFGSLYPRPLPCPSVVTLVDIQERFFPEYFTNETISNRLFQYDNSMKMADEVITISAFSKDSMIELAGISPDKISVIYLCQDILPGQDRRPDNLPADWDGQYGFYPANNWPHKNHVRLLEAIVLMKKHGDNPRFVFTGSRAHAPGEIEQQIREMGLVECVRHLGTVSRPEIAWLYRHARALTLPSLFEGFGIPVVEAMNCDLPVICSGTTSLPEVAGEAALYFDPFDPADMARTIQQGMTDNRQREHLVRAAQIRRKMFSPEKLVNEHAAAFERAANKYHPLRYWKRRLIDAPLSVHGRPATITPAIRNKARQLLEKSYHGNGEQGDAV